MSMSEVKWIKIVTDIFDDEKMYAIETLQDGMTIEVVWFKLLCLAGKCNENGFLTINNKFPYTDEMLAKIFRLDLGIVKRALETFQSLEMIEVVDNTYMVSNWLKYQSGDGLEKLKQQRRDASKRWREKQKQLEVQTKRDITRDMSDDITPSISYSFKSSSSNIDNLIYITTHSNYKYKDYISSNTELLGILKEWMEYKDSRTPKKENHYGTEMGMKKFLTITVEHDMEYGTEVLRKEFDKAIAQGWKGVVWDNVEKHPKLARRKVNIPQTNNPQHTETEKEWDAFFGDE